MTTTMTITVPTGKSGELAYFKIEFPKADFSDVMENISILVKPSDVMLAEEMGMWKVI
jgi:hypothetical protein